MQTAEKNLNHIDISVVLPVYNEVDNLPLVQAELDNLLGGMGVSYQIVYVNDGSSDGSVEKLEMLCAENPDTVTFVDLRRNFGQTAAIAAGVDHARGDIVIFMDADLQDDPSNIPMMLEKLDEGYDLVSGWRKDRQDKFITRKLPSMIANAIISWVTGVRLHDYGCSLKVYRREILEEVKLYGEMHRFIPVFASAAGAKITEVVVNHRARRFGQSKYGLERTLKVILDLMTVKFLLSYRTTPMYLFGSVGLFFFASSIGTLLFAFIRAIVRDSSLIRTPLPVFSATLFAIGTQSILLGLTTELLVRTYYEAQNKPIYVVRRIIEGQNEHIVKPSVRELFTR